MVVRDRFVLLCRLLLVWWWLWTFKPRGQTACEAASSSLLEDQQVLLEIKAVLLQESQSAADVSGNLSNWINNNGSSTGDDPCGGWNRVTCSIVQNDYRVTALDLSWLSINARLSSIHGFSNLTALSILDLSHNNFQGSISEDISHCIHLSSLNLSFNSLTSFDQHDFSLLSNLVSLDVASNNINSTLDRAIPENCSNLRKLNLSSNSFFNQSASRLWSGSCINLQTLDLSYNAFSGPLSPPISFCSTSLLHLNISDNRLDGTFPLSLTNCLSLQQLDLSGNRFAGPIPSEIVNLTALEVLNLSENNFTGSIPRELGGLSNLKVFMAGSNGLSGSIPSELSGCKRLMLLDLNANRLSDSFPGPLSEIPSLMYLVLHSNDFHGPIQDSLFNNMSALSLLDVSNNTLSGTISPLFANLSSLRFLLLAANDFTGEVPRELGRLQLQFLDLSSNRLSGSIPSSFGKLQDLLWLMLARNNLSGAIPAELGNCSSLQWLNLKSNALSGQLPKELATMGHDPSRIMAFNRLQTKPPKALGECLMMKRWIPEDYAPYSFQYARVQDSARCKSFWIDLLTVQQQLDVNDPLFPCQSQIGPYIQVTDNSLTGPIPSILQQNQTSTLLLGSNLLDGGLPGGLGSHPLRYLNVSHNNLGGIIPSAIADDACFALLDLSYNNFSGPLPKSIGNLSQLSKFNVSYNPLLTGSIPSVGQYLTFGPDSYINDTLLCFEIAPGMRANVSAIAMIPFCDDHDPSSAEPPTNRAATTRHTTTRIPMLIATLVVVGFSSILLCLGVRCYVLRRCSSSRGSSASVQRSVSNAASKEVKTLCADEFCTDDDDNGDVCRKATANCLFRINETNPWTNLQQLTYEDIAEATNGFHGDNVVGQGGFGTVYKGRLKDGSTVAIKRLTHHGFQANREFQTEMEMLGSLVQENLVPLLGFCSFGSERLLVYRYLSNGSLDHWLHVTQEGPEMLTWPIRLKIASNCAKALAYLHHECSPALIHRDIKASNILLDEEFDGYLADFGLARELDPGSTHVSTVIAGTLGYVPPEYCQTWRATTKGDVYSFGVVMLELITGRQPICRITSNKPMMMMTSSCCSSSNNNEDYDGSNDSSSVAETQNVVEWAKSVGRAEDVYDRVVRRTGQDSHLRKFLELAHACSHELPDQRPSMKDVSMSLQHLMMMTMHQQQASSGGISTGGG